jgi:hypothetical protein
MDIIITAWALDSYLDLKHRGVFTAQEYKGTIRPDALLLQQYPGNPKFQNPKFWSQATDRSKNRIPDGFKMKWHNLGNGKVQMRLPVGIFTESFLCEAYVKGNLKEEQRKIARFKTHLELIRRGQYTECGRLS